VRAVADPEIVGGGDVVEAEGREGDGGGEGVPLATGEGSGKGAALSPEFLFSILDLKMASFGALWVPVGAFIPHPRLDPPLSEGAQPLLRFEPPAVA